MQTVYQIAPRREKPPQKDQDGFSLTKLFFSHLTKFLNKLLFLARKMFRDDDRDRHEMIPLPIPPDVLEALSLDSEHFPALGSGRNLYPDRTVRRLDGYAVTEGRLRE